MDDGDIIAIRRKSGFLPETLPEKDTVEEEEEPEETDTKEEEMDEETAVEEDDSEYGRLRQDARMDR
jgi:hypothetical protein